MSTLDAPLLEDEPVERDAARRRDDGEVCVCARAWVAGLPWTQVCALLSLRAYQQHDAMDGAEEEEEVGCAEYAHVALFASGVGAMRAV